MLWTCYKNLFLLNRPYTIFSWFWRIVVFAMLEECTVILTQSEDLEQTAPHTTKLDSSSWHFSQHCQQNTVITGCRVSACHGAIYDRTPFVFIRAFMWTNRQRRRLLHTWRDRPSSRQQFQLQSSLKRLELTEDLNGK